MKFQMTRRDAMKMVGAGTLVALAGGAASCSAESPSVVAGPAALGAFRDGKYVLPDLPYAADALEPAYDARTVQIHHDKHHAGYVRGLNTTLDKLADARKAGDDSQSTALSRALAFHGSGHVLHTLFWNSMTPGGAKMPDAFAKAVAADFGSADAMIAQLAAATKAVEGSGWGVLAYEPVGGRMLVFQAEKHQNLAMWGAAPLLVCDVWEHAYYLKYANNRGAWVDAFLTIANWPFAARCYDACAKMG